MALTVLANVSVLFAPGAPLVPSSTTWELDTVKVPLNGPGAVGITLTVTVVPELGAKLPTGQVTVLTERAQPAVDPPWSKVTPDGKV